jgi:hypothetical protein
LNAVTFFTTPAALTRGLGAALPHIRFSLQVESPLRGTTKSKESEESVFVDNWSDTVVIHFRDHQKNETRKIKTTQGRLYSLLWKGDIAYLDETNAAPKAPSTAMDLFEELPIAMEQLRSTVSKGVPGGVLFLMPFDPTLPLLRNKRRWLLEPHDGTGPPHHGLATPDEAGLKSPSAHTPTSKVAWFVYRGRSVDEVSGILKRAFYKPAQDRKTDRDQFRVSAHGQLVTL